MREIKYRVWNEELEEMYTISKEKYLGSTGIVDPYVGHEKAVWMQFTGLTDVNGREIYEGDIIHCRYLSFIEFNTIVRFGKYEQDGSAGEYISSTCFGFYAEAIDKDKKSDWGIRIVPDYAETASLLDFDDFEVIGNIYENPELLKEKN